jgi:hypothetical protein
MRRTVGTHTPIDKGGLLAVNTSQHSGKLTVYASLNDGQRTREWALELPGTLFEGVIPLP